MNVEELLRDADGRRRAAMVEGDVDALEGLLAADLIWTHSSGRTDGKGSFIDKIASKAVEYLSLEVADDVVRRVGDAVIHQGTLQGRVRAESGERALRNRFLSVWRLSGDSLELLAWQSTGL